MSVLVYAESDSGSFKKIAFEVVSYAKGIADAMGTSVTAVTVNANDPSELGTYGASKVLAVSNDAMSDFNANGYANAIATAAKNEGASVVVLPSSANGKYLAPLVAVKLEAAMAANVVALPESTSPFVVKSTVYTNKAFANTQLNTANKVLGLSKNAYGLHESSTTAQVEALEAQASDGITVASVDKATDKVTIADAEIVVSGGRGLKGPENWGMIEELAEVLGAATACSKPVSDMGWRPHSEHVGQTGKPVASTLYIAIGISGAIQHLAGINSSKVKVVINTDPEAPFFKAADYGIVGDAFDVVPKLIEKLKEFKVNNA
ncbi:MAG: electron transfer flavoprotein subunit alpha/FixB family protein [Gilvibacter sp.]